MTAEHDQLRETVRDAFAKGVPWQRLTGELGLTALGIPEEFGGFGASFVEVGVVLEEAGAVLLADPLLSTVVAAAALDPALPAAAALLPSLADGTTVATLACGDGEHVLDGQVADVLVVAVGDDLHSVRGGAVEPYTTLDPTRGQARLALTSTPDNPVGIGTAGRALDLLRLALAAESIGVARASLESTVEYLRTRRQFGVPLATFQALRHRVADLYVALEQARSSVQHGLQVADTPELAVAAPLAKLVACDAAFDITAAGIQLHGGIGFTWEHSAHRYFKRATANRLLAGDPVTLRRLIGERAGIFSRCRPPA